MLMKALPFVLALSSFATFADQAATSVSGFDRIDGTKAVDCIFVSRSLNADGSIAVGINSTSAEYVNTLVRFPKQALPLSDGFQFTDPRGMKASYSSGKLTVTRQRGEGIGAEKTLMEIVVDESLSHATSASVVKSDVSRVLASIQCKF